LVAELARLDDTSFEHFEAGHAPRSALLARALLAPQDQVKLVKRLAWRAQAKADAAAAEPRHAAAAAPRSLPPTHLVHDGVAYRIGAAGVVVGREADRERRTLLVGPEHSGVSRLHCEVVLRDGELKLRDLSTFGTFVNERRIAGEATLNRADVIRVGSPGAELHVVSLEGEQ
jgi:pSer/pThr/pTyr-binding forkhead associated (FHA) protein